MSGVARRSRSPGRSPVATLLALSVLAMLATAAIPAAARRGPARPASRARTGATPARRAAPPSTRFAGFADSGAFLHFNGPLSLGTVGFAWRRDGHVESRTLAGRTGLGGVTMRIEPDARGDWRRIWMGVHQDSALLERVGRKIAVHLEGRIDTLPLEPRMLLHGPPVLLDQVPSAYDRARGGAQTFPVLVLPIHLLRGTITRLDPVTRPIAGAPRVFERWSYDMPSAHLVLWTDASGRACLVVDREGPGFVRLGYEALRDSSHAAARRDSVAADTLRPGSRDSTRRSR